MGFESKDESLITRILRFSQFTYRMCLFKYNHTCYKTFMIIFYLDKTACCIIPIRVNNCQVAQFLLKKREYQICIIQVIFIIYSKFKLILSILAIIMGFEPNDDYLNTRIARFCQFTYGMCLFKYNHTCYRTFMIIQS